MLWTVSLLALPFVTLAVRAVTFPSSISPPVPVVIWHGLGDRYDAEGLLSLKADLEDRPDLAGVFVHIVRVAEDGAGDQRATFIGDANAQVAQICAQLLDLPEIMDPALNPSRKFDAIGFSQGGQLLRALVERCGGKRGLNVRNLITVGAQHMGVSAMPPCPPGSSPFGACRLMHLSIVREGLYSGWAQSHIVPAQYFRDEARIDDYLSVNEFLKDINNERVGDKEVGPVPDRTRRNGDEPAPAPRNATYKANLASLSNFVMLRFSEDATVVPPQSAHFTLPSPFATNCPSPPDPLNPSCYLDPIPYSYLPLFAEDYVGLRQLDLANKMHLGVCEGQHMEIGPECWESIVAWLGNGADKAAVRRDRGARLILQL